MQAEFYLDKLYPLQDQVLSDLTRLDSKFYLSGGTTISRCYTNHRYSDDLDFFMNSASIFKSETERVLDFLKRNYELEIVNQYEDFVRIQIVFSNFSLKVDFINDIPFHAGEIIHHPLYHRIDSIENILSNKLSALTRGEPKDISDIIALSCFTNFDWRQLID
ncbi:MAG: nucleotidyl transferase AbiEii/AbiGii toxin family protein, partial [Cytophagales bacterium]|nr:nucleotidyl transferase AbiEii/AbiGii toxin family protein [Cytophagales bacterium]